jgi:LysR substrate binding domain
MEPAVLAVGTGHRLASRRRPVSLEELRRETFALVDPRDGPGFNRAVVARCKDAGFEPRLAANPRGPMAWETAVRMDGCVGLTTRSAAASTARDLRLLELREGVGFPLQVVRPALPLASLKPVARAFRRLAREMAASGLLAQT